MFVYFDFKLNTGRHCKIEYSESQRPWFATTSKIGSIHQVVNQGISVICFFLLFTTLAGAGGHYWFRSSKDFSQRFWYLRYDIADDATSAVVYDSVIMIFRYFLLSYTFIPIALYVSMRYENDFVV